MTLAEPNRWREVALLAGAKAARGAAANLWQLVDELCCDESGDAEIEVTKLLGAQIAARALVETADLSRLSPANQRKLTRVQRWLLKLLCDERLPTTERALAGDNLAVLGDPRFSTEYWHLPDQPLLGFIEIPAGPFTMGSDPKRDEQASHIELPQHRVDLPSYYLARWPVTVAQFAAFVRDSGHKPANPDCLNDIANHPVVYVTWHEAMAYCHWLGKQLRPVAHQRLATEELLSEPERRFWQGLADGSLGVGLPSEVEWEKAARGIDGWIYPWGDLPDPQKANISKTGLDTTTAVGCFSGGTSIYGCEEMAGNVWEWTRSLWGEDWRTPTFNYPYNPSDGREDFNASDEIRRVLRGGAFRDSARDARCAARGHGNRGSRGGIDGGIRVVASPFFSDR